MKLGAVGYLNARPLVYGLEREPRFDLRYDIPSECATLLHAHTIDVGLIPSIEYLRGSVPYRIVPGPAVTSRGPVASVAIYTRLNLKDIRSIAMDTSSRTSVALATVLLKRIFGVTPAAVPMAPDLDAMLARADAALIIGDVALFLDPTAESAIRNPSAIRNLSAIRNPSAIRGPHSAIQKVDLGEAWTSLTGLPFVYAVWAGWPGAASPEDIAVLQRARDRGVADVDGVARAYYPGDPARQRVAEKYLRDNIRYYLGDEERAGLETFYRYAVEAGVVATVGELRFY